MMSFVDERITPEPLWWSYNKRYGFTLDVAANARNAKTSTYYDLAADGLSKPWVGHRVWCNPPYSNIGAWLDKAHVEFKAGCDLIVMLLPASRTDQRWWQRLVEPFRDRPGGWLRTEFLSGRINFGTAENECAKWKSSAPFGCVVLIFERADPPIIFRDEKGKSVAILDTSNL